AALAGILSYNFNGFLQGFQRYGSLAAFRFSSQAVRVGVSIGLLLLGLGVAAVFLGWLVFNVVLALLCLLLTLKILAEVGGKTGGSDPLPLSMLFKFSLPMMIYDLVIYLSDSADKFVVLSFLGPKIFGVYTVAMTGTTSLIMILINPMIVTMIPGMSEVYGRVGVEKISAAFKLSTRYISLFFLPACIGLATLSPLLITILAGSRYMEAALPFSIATLGLCAYGFSAALLASYVALGRTLRVAFAVLLAALLEFAFSLLLVPHLGVVGASISRALMYALMLGFLLLSGFKLMRVSFDGKAFKGGGIASVGMALGLAPLAWATGYKLFFLPLYLLVGLAVYLSIAYLLGAIGWEDLLFLARMIPKGEKVLQALRRLLEKTSQP
ncbi:MAG: hypothetical protein DRO52_05690, partial [Candidatus Hecatellales archaeon]